MLLDNENEKMAIINRQQFNELENMSMNSASTITQKWEADARKDPEEEYFRLVSQSFCIKFLFDFWGSTILLA